MKPLTPQTVFIPVDGNKELPTETGMYYCQSESLGTTIAHLSDLTHAELYLRNKVWLKEASVYAFTKEELEMALRDAHKSGTIEGHRAATQGGSTIPARNNYIKEILPFTKK